MLPPELLAEIINHIHDTPTILSFTLVSRQCHALAVGGLFRSLVLHTRNLEQVVQLLEQTPNYRDRVQSVQWVCTVPIPRDDNQHLANWRRLLPLVPRVHTISIKDGDFDTLPAYFQQGADGKILSLANLQHLTITLFDPSDNRISLLLSSIQNQLVTLRVVVSESNLEDEYELELPPGVTDISFTRLETLSVPSGYLSEPIKVPNRTLRHLLCEGYAEYEVDDVAGLVNFAKEEMLELLSLELETASLEVLEHIIGSFRNLQYFGWAPCHYEAASDSVGFQSTANQEFFSALKRLEQLVVVSIVIRDGYTTDELLDLDSPSIVKTWMRAMHASRTASEERDFRKLHTVLMWLPWNSQHWSYRFVRRDSILVADDITENDYEALWEETDNIPVSLMDEFDVAEAAL